MKKILRSPIIQNGLFSSITGALSLVEKFLDLEARNLQANREFEITSLEIKKRANLIRAKIETDFEIFERKLSLVEKEMEHAHQMCNQTTQILLETISLTSDINHKTELIKQLCSLSNNSSKQNKELLVETFQKMTVTPMVDYSQRKLNNEND